VSLCLIQKLPWWKWIRICITYYSEIRYSVLKWFVGADKYHVGRSTKIRRKHQHQWCTGKMYITKLWTSYAVGSVDTDPERYQSDNSDPGSKQSISAILIATHCKKIYSFWLMSRNLNQLQSKIIFNICVMAKLWRSCSFTPIYSLTGPVGQWFASRLGGSNSRPRDAPTYNGTGFSW
jgi:hypothetical protein